MRSSLLIIAILALSASLFVSPASAQLVGSDTAPGASCSGFPAGAARITADADQDGKEITLICDGSVWQPAGGGGGGLWSSGAGDEIYYNSGTPMVGIGTNDPQTLLQLGAGDDTSGTPLLVLSEDGSGQPSMNFVDYGNDITAVGITNDDYFAIATEDTQSGFQFKVDGDYTTDMLNTATPVLTITTSGNAGIGTDNPQAELDVVGAIQTSDRIKIKGTTGLAAPVTP